MGLTERNSSQNLRFEVDGANAARDFMEQHRVSERDIEDVSIVIALHTTPGVPEHMRPTVALVTAGVATTFGNVKADVLALKDPHHERINFCSIIECGP